MLINKLETDKVSILLLLYKKKKNRLAPTGIDGAKRRMSVGPKHTLKALKPIIIEIIIIIQQFHV